MGTDQSWLEGLETRADAVLDPSVAAYVRSGSGAGHTVAAATGAWADLALHPRVMVDVREVDVSTSVLGRRSAVPWGVAPTTLQRAVHPDGEVAVAEATRDAGALLVVSSNAGTTFAEIGRTGARWWVQVYVPQDRDLVAPLLESAVVAGAEAVVLTLDTPVVGRKRGRAATVWDDVDPGAVRVNLPPELDGRPGAAKARDLGPDDIALLHAATGLPVVAKGVLRADDARRCVDAGAAAVWVSNHGGRQLDRTVPTARALPGVAEAVGADTEVYVDGGLRSGLDVVTALAAGARHCFVGRPALWALADGRDGVTRLHAELRSEVEEAMTLAGAADVDALTGLLGPRR